MSKWTLVPLGEILELQRRWVKVDPFATYEEIGVRCFGKGIFHKPAIDGMILGNKRVLSIEPDDLVFNNVFAWEGAVAVAGPEENGKIGSHRFVTYTVNPELATPQFLQLYFTTEGGLNVLRKASPGSAGRNKTLGLERFISQSIPLPPRPEQLAIVEWINAVATRIEKAQDEVTATTTQFDNLLMSAFNELASCVPRRPLEEVAPLTRRPIEVNPAAEYPGISTRSFGRGTFHNPPLAGSEITWQKPYQVKAGDILVSNIKAWEGSIAVVKPEDDGRFGSHRYLTFAPIERLATPHFVCFYLLSPEGLHHVGEASPGSADRNRTTGSKAMQKIPVPVPPYEQQLWFDALYAKVAETKQLIAENQQVRDALLPSVLNQVFNGRE